MTLEVPLTLRVGNKHVTRAASGVTFRKEAVGGVKAIALNLGHTLDALDADLAAYSRVYIYDARTGATVAEGRLSDTGRAASSSDGQVWQMTAFGPAAHAEDITAPLVYVDQSISDGWREIGRVHAGGETSLGTSPPGDTSANPPQGTLLHWPNGEVLATNDSRSVRYTRAQECGMKLARAKVTILGGRNSTDIFARVALRTDGDAAQSNRAVDVALSTTATTYARVVGTDFANGRNTLDYRMTYTGAGWTVNADNAWGYFYDSLIRTLLLNADGTEKTTGYGNNYVLAHEIVADLLGRLLPQFDGANAAIDTGAAHQIDSLTYVDGVTPRQVLDDLMALEPAYRWTTGPANGAGKYAFRWEPWPTTVRYEVTLDDGGDFPASSQELYNRVLVRWVDNRGAVRSTIRTGACKILEDAGVVRQAVVDLGGEVSSLANAQRVGDNFLADHNVPANAGTLVVNRPVRDLKTGGMALPHEIEPGELIRVRGVAAYPDALNASSNDGVTVFRIWSMTYNSDGDSASLELDTYARTTANAIASLQQRRQRKG